MGNRDNLQSATTFPKHDYERKPIQDHPACAISRQRELLRVSTELVNRPVKLIQESLCGA
jgi:hypothetical protein